MLRVTFIEATRQCIFIMYIYYVYLLSSMLDSPCQRSVQTIVKQHMMMHSEAAITGLKRNYILQETEYVII